jgi:hypothetical protein
LGRAKGRCIAAALAYLERGELEDRRTGLVYDYRRRGGLVAKGAFFPQVEKGELKAQERNLSRQEKEEFCLAVELKEIRKDGRLAKEVLAAIPAELPQEKQLELARSFATKLVERYQIGTFFAIHEPPEGGDRRNFHLHLLLTTRELDGSGTLGQKVRELDSKSEMEFLKKTWQELANEILPEGKKLEEPQKDPLGEPKMPHLGRKATWFERQTGQKSRKRLEFEAQLKEWQTYTSELKELERQRQELERQWQEQERRQAEQERQRAEQERQRQAELERRQAELERQRAEQERQRQAELERRQAEERQRQQQENKEYQQKYHYFSSTKKLINRYKNIEIGHDAEGKIFLRNPELILKYSEIPSYHLQDLRNIYLDVKESILNDLNKRIEDLINSDYFSKDKSLRSFLERTSRKFYETPIQVLSDQELIDLFPIISELEQNPDYQDFIVFRQYEEHQDFYNKSLNYNDSPFYKSSSIYYENDDKKEEIDLEENDEELEY